jgi:hypothetical protein
LNGRKNVVAYFLENFCDQVLRVGTPKPLWIASWNLNCEAVLEEIFKYASVEDINQPGPDGMKVLWILIQTGHSDFVFRHRDKFGDWNVLQMAIALKCDSLFEKMIQNMDFDPKTLIPLAIKSKNVTVLRHFPNQCFYRALNHCDVKVASIDGSSEPEIIPVSNADTREALGLTANQTGSFVVDLSITYPIYNPATEKEYSFGKAKKKGSLSVKQDILAHVRDRFCSLVRPEATPGTPVRRTECRLIDMQLQSECQHRRY